MRQLTLTNSHFKFLLGKYNEWMNIEKYQPFTIKAYSEALQQFFHYLEQRQIMSIRMVEQKHLAGFKSFLQTRKNMLTEDSGIHNITINGIIKGVNCFVRHLNQTDSSYQLDIYEGYLPIDTAEKMVLSQDEVMALYNATFEQYTMGSTQMGQRDRVMLAIFYGCGIRLNEGRNINLSDIDFPNKRILVRLGKGKKERYVPIPNKHLADIQAYIQQGREWFKYKHYSVTAKKYGYIKEITKQDEDALFLNVHGKRMKSFQQRLNLLAELANIQKRIGTHCLRHSVATHLLMNGWKLEQVSKFLGHASIDSTQVYTHIANQFITGHGE